MNLNKLLCKYIDKDGRGHVTIGNMVTVVSTLTTLLIIRAGYVRCATLLMKDNYCEAVLFDMSILDVGVINSVCIAIAIVLTVLVFATFLALVLARTLIIVGDVWHTEITTCDRTDEDE